MNKVYLIVLWSCFSILWSSCGDSNASSDESAVKEEPEAAAEVTGEKLYPSISLDTLEVMYQQCDYIDYVFYYTNFSISQNEREDIQQALRYISEAVPTINPNCKPIGRLFFQVEGENRMEADLYFQEGCTYYVFYEDGKPAFANEIMPAGIQFYNKIFNTVNAK